MTRLRIFWGPEALDQIDTVRSLYAEVYAEPPYFEGPADVEAFVATWEGLCDRPGHRLVIASEDGVAAGFAFGYLLPGDSHWWDGLLQLIETDLTRETGSRTFAINELAVRAKLRQQGIARRMHERLLSGLNVERVTLLSRPEAEAAQASYRSWGYRRIGALRPYPDAPLYDAMLKSIQ